MKLHIDPFRFVEVISHNWTLNNNLDDTLSWLSSLYIAFLLMLLIRFDFVGLRKTGGLIVALYISGLLTMTFLEDFNITSIFIDPNSSRLTLFFSSPNFLGASLSIGLASVLILLQPRYIAILLQPVGIAAIFLTGSRTSLAASVIVFVVWCIIYPNLRFIRMVSLLLCVLLVCCLYIYFDDLSNPTNLLHLSDAFTHPFWRVSEETRINIDDAPSYYFREYEAGTHLRGRNSSDNKLIILQSIGRSHPKVKYVASIYLRSDVPSHILLNSQLKSVVCDVGVTWQRCETPAGDGDGRLSVQLRLETIKDGGQYDFYAHGAQIETGSLATELERKNLLTLRASRLVKSLSKGEFTDEGRKDAAMAAWQMFIDRPIAGVGIGRFREVYVHTRYAERSPYVTHAHNLPLQLLAETGVLGFLSWFVPFFGIPLLFWRQKWRYLLPMIMCILVLNLTDYTYYNNGVYYIYWLTVGLICFGNQTPRYITE